MSENIEESIIDPAAEKAANASVKTVQILDPRIEPQPDPVYQYTIGPIQNQYYQIPASGLSDSNITFNNLTTLGIDRAYLDTFELEISAVIKFRVGHWDSQGSWVGDGTTEVIPRPDEWTFQSFPFNTCCSEAHVNINGGAFMTQPMCYIRAKERYMRQYELSKCYENICPCHKPVCQTESGRNFLPNGSITAKASEDLFVPTSVTVTKTTDDPPALSDVVVAQGGSYPTRYGIGMNGFMQSDQGMEGGFNNSIVELGKPVVGGYENMYREGEYLIVKVTWREPVMCSPFSSKYDGTYGRPLYNITSMDFSFTMMDLGNMIRLSNIHGSDKYVRDYTVNIEQCKLCYQVMTIPNVLKKPTTTLVPYRRFVPYITEFFNNGRGGGTGSGSLEATGGEISISSGVYTFNQVPTAIWVFAGPSKSIIQTNYQDSVDANPDAGVDIAGNVMKRGNWESNNLFGYLKHINISLANTTQILATATKYDLYRIAKANGCQDSYLSWGRTSTIFPKNITDANGYPFKIYNGAGSVLRLIPGTDIILPDHPLIPAANANNMVLQVTAEFDIPPHSANKNQYALWILFEEVGVAAISPGQCEITMNPVGSGEVMGVSPVMSATSNYTEGAIEGAGWLDAIKKAAEIAGQVADTGIISRILRRLKFTKAADWASKHGFGEMDGGPARKRCRGGAVIGHGMNDWV